MKFLIAALVLFTACHKASENVTIKFYGVKKEEFTQYIIEAGAHFVTNNPYKPIELAELKFAVKFDSSAIYNTSDPVNQYDINKLYGFSDNNALHHEYSARLGWSWNEQALRLYAYVYNNGQVVKKELKTIQIGSTYQCSIKVEADLYVFAINDELTILPRSSTTFMAKGYLLYPYFGGDETAPHDIRIQIKDL